MEWFAQLLQTAVADCCTPVQWVVSITAGLIVYTPLRMIAGIFTKR